MHLHAPGVDFKLDGRTAPDSPKSHAISLLCLTLASLMPPGVLAGLCHWLACPRWSCVLAAAVGLIISVSLTAAVLRTTLRARGGPHEASAYGSTTARAQCNIAAMTATSDVMVCTARGRPGRYLSAALERCLLASYEGSKHTPCLKNDLLIGEQTRPGLKFCESRRRRGQGYGNGRPR
jgi:hypothetical protein